MYDRTLTTVRISKGPILLISSTDGFEPPLKCTPRTAASMAFWAPSSAFMSSTS